MPDHAAYIRAAQRQIEAVAGLARRAHDTGSTVKSWTIGSSEQCDIRIAGDEYVSGMHAQVILRSDGRAWVTDLGSTNGTWLRPGTTAPPVSAAEVYRSAVRVVAAERPVSICPGDSLWVGRTHIPWSRVSDSPRLADIGKTG